LEVWQGSDRQESERYGDKRAEHVHQLRNSSRLMSHRHRAMPTRAPPTEPEYRYRALVQAA